MRRNHPSIPFAAGAAFRRRGPSLCRRLSARQRLGHTPPGPAPTASGRSGTARSRDQTSVAPVGTRPVSENRQSAMSSLRASAHDHHPADPSTGPRSALVEPLAERAIRLIAQPAPRHLDELCPDPCWTVAADPLVALRVSARPRGWRHTDPAREFATIAEPVPSIYSIVPPNDGSALRHGHHFEPVDFVIDHGRGHHDAYSAGSCQRTYARAYGCRQRPRRHREELIESERRWSGREAFVTMMQTADLGQGNDRSRPGRLNGSSIRCVLADRQVGP